jgi:hypothetical protein
MRRTTILGYDMQRQSARRGLVIAVYSLLAALLTGGWFLDHLQTTGIYVYFAVFFINYFVLGGYGSSGLIKPFTGKGPRTQPAPSNLVELELYAAGNLARNPDEYRNDERELQRRDRVHYQAWQAVVVLFCPIWLIAIWQNHPPRFIPAGLLPSLLYLFVLPAILIAVTLPQAILLWTEPDLDPQTEPAPEPAPALHSGR